MARRSFRPAVEGGRHCDSCLKYSFTTTPVLKLNLLPCLVRRSALFRAGYSLVLTLTSSANKVLSYVSLCLPQYLAGRWCRVAVPALARAGPGAFYPEHSRGFG